MKKIIIPAVCSAVFSIGDLGATDNGLNNVYVGTSVGYDMASYRIQGVGGNTAVRGVNGGLYVGYMKNLNPIMCGLEASYDRHTMKYKSNTSESTAKNSFGLSARFGKIFDGLITCLRLGWVNTGAQNKALVSGVRVRDNKRINGFISGLYFGANVTNRMVAGCEYTYTKYGAKKFKNTLNNKEVAFDVSNFKLRLSYKF